MQPKPLPTVPNAKPLYGSDWLEQNRLFYEAERLQVGIFAPKSPIVRVMPQPVDDMAPKKSWGCGCVVS